MQKIKIAHVRWNFPRCWDNFNMLTSIVMCTFLFSNKNTLLGKVGWKSLNCSPKKRLGCQTDLHMFNSIVYVEFFLFWTENTHFEQAWSTKTKTGCLRWLFVSWLIQISWIRWECWFCLFWTRNISLSKFGSKIRNCMFRMKLGIHSVLKMLKWW